MKCARTVLLFSIITGMAFAGIVTMFNNPNYLTGLKQSTELFVKNSRLYK